MLASGGGDAKSLLDDADPSLEVSSTRLWKSIWSGARNISAYEASSSLRDMKRGSSGREGGASSVSGFAGKPWLAKNMSTSRRHSSVVEARWRYLRRSATSDATMAGGPGGGTNDAIVEGFRDTGGVSRAVSGRPFSRTGEGTGLRGTGDRRGVVGEMILSSLFPGVGLTASPFVLIASGLSSASRASPFTTRRRGLPFGTRARKELSRDIDTGDPNSSHAADPFRVRGESACESSDEDAADIVRGRRADMDAVGDGETIRVPDEIDWGGVGVCVPSPCPCPW